MRNNKQELNQQQCGDTLTPTPRNQIEYFEKELQGLKNVIDEQKEELLQLYRRIYVIDRPERSY